MGSRFWLLALSSCHGCLTVTDQLWSWVLSAIGVTGLLLVGRRHWWAWGITALNEVLWIVYAVVTRQFGFIFGALAYISVHAHNARRWRGQS
jgi:hypothetical protein